MPLVIEELSTSLEIQDEVAIKKLVREEVRRQLAEQRSGRAPADDVDPSDPAAGGTPNEGG
jgi:hypothetical protein